MTKGVKNNSQEKVTDPVTATKGPQGTAHEAPST